MMAIQTLNVHEISCALEILSTYFVVLEGHPIFANLVIEHLLLSIYIQRGFIYISALWVTPSPPQPLKRLVISVRRVWSGV